MEGLFVYAAGMPNIWKKVRLEILGPFTTTAEGHRYLVFAVDVHTYWMEGRSLAHSSPDLIARFIFSLFARFGRAEFSVVGQKADFCRQLAASLQALLRSQDSSYGMGPTNNSGVVHHGRHGAEQVYHLPDLGPDAGITTGGMALNPDGQLNCDQADDLPPEQANLFAHSDPVNPLPRHGSFTRVSRSLKQRSVNYTNLGSDLLNFVSANMEDWDAKLDGCLYHMRTAIAVCNKGYSAFHLAYGRNPAPITGRELMVRSLRGVKEVLNLFSLTGAEKKPTSQLSSQQSEPKEAAGSAPQSNVAKKLSTKRYNLRTGALPLSPVCRETESPLHDGPQHTSHPSISGPTDDIRLTGSGVCSTAQRGSTSIPAHSAAATTAETSSKAAAAAEKSSKKNISSKLGRKSRRRKRADVLKVKCPTCPNTYVTSQEELALHLECHSEDVCGDRIFRCPECPKVCKIWLNMVRHMGQHRDISTFRKLPADCYKCKHCLKDFKVPECLREHVRVVHEGQKRFECHICHEKFKVYKTKMRHMDIKHANITYTCDVCPYSTKVRRNLKQHADAHEKKKQKVKAGSDENRSDEAAAGPAQFTVSHSGPIFFGTDESDHLEGPSDASHASVSGQLGFLRPMFPTPHELVPDSSTPSTSSLSLVSRAHFEQPLQLPLTSLPPGPSQSIVYLSATGNLISSTHNPASGQLQPGLFTLQLAGSALPGFSAVQFPEQQVFST